jgi:CBS domain-containing protein
MCALTVRDLCDPERPQSVIVRGDAPLDTVLRCFSQGEGLRSIFVNSNEGRLLGVITRVDILEWIRLRIGAGISGPNLTSDRLIRLAQLVRASTAQDAIHPDSDRAVIRLDDPLDEALRTMLTIDLVALPVIDETGRIVGEVAISGVLRKLLEADEEAAPAC